MQRFHTLHSKVIALDFSVDVFGIPPVPERMSIGAQFQLWRLTRLHRKGERLAEKVRNEKDQAQQDPYDMVVDITRRVTSSDVAPDPEDFARRFTRNLMPDPEIAFLETQLQGVDERIRDVDRADFLRRLYPSPEHITRTEQRAGIAKALAWYALYLEGWDRPHVLDYGKRFALLFDAVSATIGHRQPGSSDKAYLHAAYEVMLARKPNRAGLPPKGDRLSHAIEQYETPASDTTVGNCLGLTLFDLFILARLGFQVGAVRLPGHILPWVREGNRKQYLENTAREFSAMRVAGLTTQVHLQQSRGKEVGLQGILAAAHNNIGASERSIPDLEWAIRLDPEGPLPYINRAILIASRAFSSVAVLTARDGDTPWMPAEVVESQRHPRVRGYDVAQSKRLIRLAVSDFDHVIASYPGLARAYWNRGVLRELLGDRDGARRDISNATRLDLKFRSQQKAFQLWTLE